MEINALSQSLRNSIKDGMVIPACPLALNENRKLDEQRQRAVLRYYIDAGAGGIAVGVHTTQFEIRDKNIGLFEPVLKLASEEIDSWSKKKGKEIFKVAGLCGKTAQAVSEAEFAIDCGYHAGLLSLSAFAKSSLDDMIEHCQEIAKIIPVIGFYLQPAVGGRILPYDFWREFAQIENVIAIKMAPFNRYQTLDVIRGVCDAQKENDITLYTGNDDNIIVDLLTNFKVTTEFGTKEVRIKGGLLGHWAVWTKKAVEQLEMCKKLKSVEKLPQEMLSLAVEVTDSNSAFFDAANSFKGCIAGIHEVLRRQGLLSGTWCLNPQEKMSAGQSEEIDRVYKAYPHLTDDEFIAENLDSWLSE